jgi:ribosomal protein S18 acetylase RimI-like enzyme
MIRKIKKQDYNQVFELIAIQNQKSEYNSSYMTTDHDLLRNDILHIVINEYGLVYIDKDKQIKGVVTMYQYNKNKLVYDIGGPYTYNDLDIAKELIFELKKRVDENAKFNFFFLKESIYYNTLMKELECEFNGFEILLELKKEDFKPVYKQDIVVRKHKNIDYQAVHQIHIEAFGENMYIDTPSMFQSKQLYILEKENEVIGYCLLKTEKTRLYIEVIAIKKQYRNIGYGSSFISKMITLGFENSELETAELVVEAMNESAIKVYTNIGFQIKKTNSSYRL